MGCCLVDCFKKLLAWFASLLQILLGVAIVLIVYFKLSNSKLNIDFWAPSNDSFSQDQCFLGDSIADRSLCIYAFIVVAASWAVSILVSILQCLTCDCCGAGGVIDLIVAFFGSIWWIAAGVVVTIYAVNANRADWPQEMPRNWVIGLTWACAGLFLFQFLVFSGHLCCGSKRGDRAAKYDK